MIRPCQLFLIVNKSDDFFLKISEIMHWFKDSDWIDERDRRHISVGQMNEMYKHFHAMYSETFFDTASNHRCMYSVGQ